MPKPNRSDLVPYFEDVQSHYDLSDDFFGLFLDPTRTYSCAYFEREEMTLEEAQLAKIDLALGKIDLQPGQKLLDIGCGWGAAAMRAAKRYHVDVIGLTLSKNQFEFATSQAATLPSDAGSIEIRLQGWEQFDEPIDRIVSIGAFEHFSYERHEEFFKRTYRLLPEDGRMLLHTIVFPSWPTLQERGIEVTPETVAFAKFIRREIFPGGRIMPPDRVTHYAVAAGYRVEREHSLQLHYARTLDQWAENLTKAKQQAVELTSENTYDKYIYYLTGCADHFRSGHLDLIQFTLCK